MFGHNSLSLFSAVQEDDGEGGAGKGETGQFPSPPSLGREERERVGLGGQTRQTMGPLLPPLVGSLLLLPTLPRLTPSAPSRPHKVQKRFSGNCQFPAKSELFPPKTVRIGESYDEALILSLLFSLPLFCSPLGVFSPSTIPLQLL